MIYGCNFAQQACIWWQPPCTVCQCVRVCVTRGRGSAKICCTESGGKKEKTKMTQKKGNWCLITQINR